MPPARALLVVASAGAVALTVRVVVLGPVPLPIVTIALVSYVALVLAGVLVPRLEMFADIVWHGPEGARGVALTFDDGPHPIHTRSVLSALALNGVRATFFVLGEKARRYPELIKEIADAGHLIGLHGDEHDRALALRSLARVRAGLVRALDDIEAMIGVRPHLYRPPVGQTNPRIARAAREAGLTIVGWSVRGLDGVYTSPARVIRRIVRGLEDGAIVLLHDAAEHDDRPPAAPHAVAGILAAISARQLATVRLDEWWNLSARSAILEVKASHRARRKT